MVRPGPGPTLGARSEQVDAREQWWVATLKCPVRIVANRAANTVASFEGWIHRQPMMGSRAVETRTVSYPSTLRPCCPKAVGSQRS